MSKIFSDDEIDNYKRLFYWYRYQFYIRSTLFRSIFDSTEEIRRFELWNEEGTDFFYISHFAIDEYAHLDDYPFPSEVSAPKNYARRGRPKKTETGSEPAETGRSGFLPIRDPKWGKFILKGNDLTRKNSGGNKKRGDFFWPFSHWEKSLLVYDLLEHGLKKTEIGNILSGKKIADVLEYAREQGVRPVKYDIITCMLGYMPPLFNDIVAIKPADLFAGSDDPYFTSPGKKDPENMRTDLLACVRKANKLAIDLICSTEKENFPFTSPYPS